MKEITQSCPLVHKPNFITIQTVSWQCLSAQNKRTSHRMGEYLIKELTKIHKTPKAQHNKRLKNGPETLTDTSKRMHRWPISQWKHEPGKKKKKKIPVHPLLPWEWPKAQNTLATPNAGKDAKQQELSFTAGGNSKWCSLLGRQTVCST